MRRNQRELTNDRGKGFGLGYRSQRLETRSRRYRVVLCGNCAALGVSHVRGRSADTLGPDSSNFECRAPSEQRTTESMGHSRA